MKLTAQRLIEVRSALAELKGRRLPDLDSTLLVTAIWANLKAAFEEYEDAVAILRKELEAADDEGKKAVLAKFEQLAKRQYEVPDVKKRLTTDNLPKHFSGKDGAGDMNVAGLAGIIIALGEEYFELKAE